MGNVSEPIEKLLRGYMTQMSVLIDLLDEKGVLSKEEFLKRTLKRSLQNMQENDEPHSA